MLSRTPLRAREVMSYSVVALGAAVSILSANGLFDDQALQGQNYCGTPLAFPVCSELSSQSGQYLALIAVGVGIIILGIYLGLRQGRARVL